MLQGFSAHPLTHLNLFSPEPGTETFEPVGRWYESYCVRRHRKHTLSASSLTSSSSEEDEDEESEFDEEDEELLMTLDPKEWKVGMDGLGTLKWSAHKFMHSPIPRGIIWPCRTLWELHIKFTMSNFLQTGMESHPLQNALQWPQKLCYNLPITSEALQ